MALSEYSLETVYGGKVIQSAPDIFFVFVVYNELSYTVNVASTGHDGVES